MRLKMLFFSLLLLIIGSAVFTVAEESRTAAQVIMQFITTDSLINTAWNQDGIIPKQLQPFYDTWDVSGKVFTLPGISMTVMDFSEGLRAATWRLAFVEYVRGYAFAAAIYVSKEKQ